MLAEGQMTYQQHLEIRRRWMQGAEAEFWGWVGAKEKKLLPYSKDPYLQQRYEQGREDGQTALMCDALRTER